MKVLIKTRNSPEHLFLVEILDKRMIKEVKRLISKKMNSKAMVTILSYGKFERELKHYEIPDARAELILTKDNAWWDLTK